MNQLTGNEEFTLHGVSAGITIKDYWQWAYSDLLNNTHRGVVAEFLVYSSLYEITFHDTFLKIDASYWDDASIRYTDIDTIEYRTNDDPDATMKRNFGYGTPFLLMGEFDSDEFGTYTRYSYTACDSCIVLTVDGKTMVVNDKDDTQTKAIYEQLLEKMN